jgi:hypothetical protein
LIPNTVRIGTEATERVIRTTLNRRRRRKRIFEKVDNSVEFDFSSLLREDHIDEPARSFLKDALSEFDFLSGGIKDPKMDLLLRALQKEVVDEGFLLINEVGESYIIHHT